MNIRDTLKRVLTGPVEQPVPEIGRNDRCWCGSGRKYKACHLTADERKRSASRASSVRGAPARGF